MHDAKINLNLPLNKKGEQDVRLQIKFMIL